MKFKSTIIVMLIAALALGITTAILVVNEAKQQTQIALQILEETKAQTQSIQNTEEETKKQTEIAIETADLISLQIDITATKIVTDQVAKDVNDQNIKSAGTAAFRRAEMEKIREALGLDALHNVSGIGNYMPDEEIINIVRPQK